MQIGTETKALWWALIPPWKCIHNILRGWRTHELTLKFSCFLSKLLWIAKKFWKSLTFVCFYIETFCRRSDLFDTAVFASKVFEVWSCRPRRHFEKPQLFYPNTEVVAKRGLVYFDGGSKASFFCILRDRWKNWSFRSLKTP